MPNIKTLQIGIQKLDSIIEKSEIFALSSGIILMALIAIANVFGRYIFNQSIYFAEELISFLVILITFFGLGYVTRKGRHIRMSAFYDQLTPRYKRYTYIFISVVSAMVMFLLAWYAYEYISKVAERGKVTPSLRFPLWISYIWVFIGFVVTGLQYVMTVFANLNARDDDIYLSPSTLDTYDDPEIAELLKTSNALDERDANMNAANNKEQ